VRSLAFSPEGDTLFSGSWDGTVRRWEVPSPRPGSAAEIRRWLEINTGQRLGLNGAVVPLKLGDWEKLMEDR
jgi:WD40 repeat protein